MRFQTDPLPAGRITCSLQVDDGAGGAFTNFSQNAHFQPIPPGINDSIQMPLTGATTKAAGSYDVRAVCEDVGIDSVQFDRGDLTVIAVAT